MTRKTPCYIQPSLFPDEENRPEESFRPDMPTAAPVNYDHSALFTRLAGSQFRSRFHLSEKDLDYIRTKGMDTIRQHAADFIAHRLAPAVIPNDGKQTPMRGHPVFKAQHATGCCCRGCFSKWHHIPAGRLLSREEQDYAVSVIMAWIDKEYHHTPTH